MSAPEQVSGAVQMQALLASLSRKLSDLPAERRSQIEGDLQKIQTCFMEACTEASAAGEIDYRQLAESIQDGFFELDRDWRFILINDRAAGSLGYSPADLVGKNIWETFPQLIDSPYETYYRQVMEQRKPVNFETAGLLTGQWYGIRVYPSAKGIVVFWMDITERKQAEAELALAHQRAIWMARLPDENPNPVARAAADGTILYHNRSAGERFGQAFAVGGRLPGRLLAVLEQANAQGEQVTCDVPLDGRVYSFTVVPYLGEQYANLYGLDITDRVQAERALKTSEEKFAKVFRSSPIALAVSTLVEGRFLEVNDSFLDLHGFTRTEMIGHTTLELGIISPEDRQAVIDKFNRGNGFRNLEVAAHAKSGQVRHILLSAEPLEINGKTRLLSVALDITERKQAEVFDRALNEISQLVHSTLHVDEVLTRSIAAAARALGCDTAALSLRKDGQWLVSGVFGFPEDILGMELNDDQERHAILAIRTKQPVAVSDAFNDERFNRAHLRKWGIRSVLVMPVVAKDEAIGVMFFNYEKAQVDFKPAHIDFVTQLAASLSLALENAQLYQSLEAEINERKLVEAQLQENEATLRLNQTQLLSAVANEQARANELAALMDAAPAIIWISRDPLCREMFGNHYSYDFLQIRQGENVSKTALEDDLKAQRYHMEKDGRVIPPEELPMQTAATTGKPTHDWGADIVYEDGTRFSLFGNVNPLFDREGKPYGAIGVFVDLTTMRRLEAEQVEAQTKIEVQRRLMDQREQERQAIARDLHDGPIQTLSGSIFHLHMIKEVFTDNALQVELNQVGLDIKNTIHELREVLNELRPPALMHFGFSRVLQLYTEDLRGRFQDIQIELDVMDDGKALPDSTRLALFRIYQEGMNNILRHSGATTAWVSYKIDRNDFILKLRDNGRGFDLTSDFAQLTRAGHFGLVGMKERVEAIGGQFAVASEPGKGTTIVVRGPVGVRSS